MKGLAIVTGGIKGIGRAISEDLTNSGYKVIANYYSSLSVAEEFNKETGIDIQRWNVADYQDCKFALEEIKEKYDMPISILINNAGISRDGMLHKLDQAKWSEVIETNLNSCFNMCSLVINEMRSQNYGRIVNISSINAMIGRIGVANYSAAKAGMLGFTRALAKESASKGITVNAIAPGYVMTDLLADVAKNVIEDIIQEIPLKRLGKPEDVSKLVSFLVSEDASYITGQTISVNGGHHMQ